MYLKMNYINYIYVKTNDIMNIKYTKYCIPYVLFLLRILCKKMLYIKCVLYILFVYIKNIHILRKFRLRNFRYTNKIAEQ